MNSFERLELLNYDVNSYYEYDIPIGETFDYKGTTLKVVRNNDTFSCNDCFFSLKKGTLSCFRFACYSDSRKDEQDVIFKDVEE